MLLRLLVVLLLLLLPTASRACELRVRRHPDPLMLVRLPSGELSGPQLETVREALRRAGCSTRVVALPWARALSDLASGELDVLPGAHRLPEREGFAHFSHSSWPSRNRLFMRKDGLARDGQPSDLEQFLRSRRLGLQVGVAYGPQLDALLRQEALSRNMQRAANRQGLWQMLAMGRVDGVLADEEGGQRELGRLGLQAQLSATELVVDAEPSHTAFSRRRVDAALVARFDAALQAMQRDGTRAQIEKRFADLLVPAR